MSNKPYYMIEIDEEGACIVAGGVGVIAEEWVEVAADKPWKELTELVADANAGRHMPDLIEFLEGIARGQYPDSDLESLHKAYQSVARALLDQIRSDSDGEDKTT